MGISTVASLGDSSRVWKAASSNQCRGQREPSTSGMRGVQDINVPGCVSSLVRRRGPGLAPRVASPAGTTRPARGGSAWRTPALHLVLPAPTLTLLEGGGRGERRRGRTGRRDQRELKRRGRAGDAFLHKSCISPPPPLHTRMRYLPGKPRERTSWRRMELPSPFPPPHPTSSASCPRPFVPSLLVLFFFFFSALW